jgi:putative hydroxymethylpyrimidine transport system substrate-binding protein
MLRPRMSKVVASLAAVLAAVALIGCGGGGAEPGAPQRATLVLDFTPNAVHSGIYAALKRGYYSDAGIDLGVRQPSASTDAPKLLQAGRTNFAILDIHDLGIARENGLDVVGVTPIVQRPLASVIARADGPVKRPRDLQGRHVGVTGLPSDDAVVDSEVSADGGDPAKVDRVTIGFNAVADLAARKVDAVTGFWNAEAVALRRRGVPVRTFRVDRYGAPPYPELVLATNREMLQSDPALVRGVAGATTRGYEAALRDPKAALDDLLAANPDLDRGEQQAQMRALLPAFSPPGRLDKGVLEAWSRWDAAHGILKRPVDVDRAFDLPLLSSVGGSAQR